jgi:hypothetical protein
MPEACVYMCVKSSCVHVCAQSQVGAETRALHDMKHTHMWRGTHTRTHAHAHTRARACPDSHGELRTTNDTDKLITKAWATPYARVARTHKCTDVAHARTHILALI